MNPPPILLSDIERRRVLDEVPDRCPDCMGEAAVVVFDPADEDWDVVLTHDLTCPVVAADTRKARNAG